jgi:leucyl-tRNA synthetase
LSLEFDEKRVLEDNLNYLLNTLEMEGVDVKFSSEASEKIQEDCRPGNTMEITN